MARLFFDGFEHGSLRAWDRVAVSSSSIYPSLVNSPMITGNFCCQRVTLEKDFSPFSEIYFGFRFFSKDPSMGGIDPREIVQITFTPTWFEGYPYDFAMSIYGGWNERLVLSVPYQSTAVAEVSFDPDFPENHIQFRIKATGATSFLWQCRLNGMTILNESLSHSLISTSMATTSIKFRAINYSYQTFYDDFVFDSSEWPGPSRIYGLSPNGNGTTNNWISSSGQNWEAVKDIPANTENYVGSNRALDLDLYELGNLPSGVAAIKGVQALALAKTSGSPALEYLRLALRTGGVNYFSSSKQLYYNYYQVLHHWATNPQTGVAWTPTQINALQAGFQLVTS